jgi:hypothetical protein
MRIGMLMDKRLKLIQDVINGIRIIKSYAWEIPFIKKVKVVREQQGEVTKKVGMISGIG